MENVNLYNNIDMKHRDRAVLQSIYRPNVPNDKKETKPPHCRSELFPHQLHINLRVCPPGRLGWTLVQGADRPGAVTAGRATSVSVKHGLRAVTADLGGLTTTSSPASSTTTTARAAPVSTSHRPTRPVLAGGSRPGDLQLDVVRITIQYVRTCLHRTQALIRQHRLASCHHRTSFLGLDLDLLAGPRRRRGRREPERPAGPTSTSSVRAGQTLNYSSHPGPFIPQRRQTVTVRH